LVPPGDPQALRSTLAELLGAPASRERLAAAAATAAAAPYSWDAIGARTVALYERLLG
jgi:glycosyltransferase involved in cell wall biosynthesis